MQNAKAKHQIMSQLFDLAIVYAFFVLSFAYPIITLIDGVNNNDSEKIYSMTIMCIIMGAVFMLFIIFYFVIVPTLTNGQTIGKKFFKIRVVRLDDGKIDVSTLFLREIIGRAFIDLSTLGLGSIVNLIILSLNSEKRGFHDILASTRVVDTY